MPSTDVCIDTNRIVVPSRRASLAQLSRWVHSVAQSGELSARAAFSLELVLAEVVTNLIEHGSAGESDALIEVQVAFASGCAIVQVEDSGPPFNPTVTPVHRRPSTLEDAPIGGLGVHLIRSYTQSWEYRRSDQKNQQRLTIALDG